MILLDGVVHVFTGADGEGASTLSQLALGITLHDGHAIGLAAVNSDLLRSAMLGQSLADKVFGSLQISGCTKQELDRIALLSIARYR